MKIFLQLLVLFNIFISNVFAGGYGHVNFVNNLTKQSITVSLVPGSENCIGKIYTSLPIHIPPKSSSMVKFYAYNHGFDCNSAISNETKKVSFLVVVSNYQKYTTTMTWQHWTSGFFNQNLHTEVTQSDTYGLNPTGGQEADGYGGVFDIGINLAPMPDGTISLQTLGLGKVSVTNGYGKLVKLSPFRNAIAVTQLDKLFFHFSKSLAVCSAVNGVIKCPNGVSFVNIDRKVTFICTQTSNESPMCPYLNIKSSTLSSMVKLENIS